MTTQTEELRRRIVADINDGVAGTKLGSERELAQRYRTSRSSLRQVLAALEEAGLVDRMIGRSGRHLHQSRAGSAQPTDVVGSPAFLGQPGICRGHPRVIHEDRRAGRPPKGISGIVTLQRLRHRDWAGSGLRTVPDLAGARAISGRRFPGVARKQLGGSLIRASWKPITVA